MTNRLQFEDLQVGDRWESETRTVRQEDVDAFAMLTGDMTPLHVDHEYASQTPYGRPIAHGLLGLSMLAGLSSQQPDVHTIALVAVRDWEFRLPIYPGDTIRVVTEVMRVQRVSRRHGRVSWMRRLINQKGDVIQEGILETLVATADGVLCRRDDGAAPRQLVSGRDRSLHLDRAAN